MRRLSTNAFRVALRQSFNVLALTSGKKRVADLIEEHRIKRLVDHRHDNVGKSAKWSRRSAPPFRSKSEPAGFYRRVVTRSEPGVQSATAFHRLAAACANRLYPSVSTGISPACDHAWFISHLRQMTNPTMFGHTRQGISCIIYPTNH